MAESKSKKGSSRISFPQRVYNVLKFTEENNQEHIISWVNNGTAFKVHDLDVFSRDFLPTYFNTHKYASFTRTLCAYGFDCVRTGRQTGICKYKMQAYETILVVKVRSYMIALFQTHTQSSARTIRLPSLKSNE